MPTMFLPMLSALLLACGDAPSESDAPNSTPSSDTPTADTGLTTPAAWTPPVSCDWTSPGPDMLQGTIEAEQDFAARLANTDLSVVPDPLDPSSTSLFERGVIHWMIGRRQGREVSHATLEQAGTLGDVIMIAAAVTGGETLDFGVLREGLQYAYTCSRPLPADLDTLKARYGDYLTWPLEGLPCGATKDERRLVWTHPEGRAVVAETVTDAGEIRETEVLFLDLREQLTPSTRPATPLECTRTEAECPPSTPWPPPGCAHSPAACR